MLTGAEDMQYLVRREDYTRRLLLLCSKIVAVVYWVDFWQLVSKRARQECTTHVDYEKGMRIFDSFFFLFVFFFLVCVNFPSPFLPPPLPFRLQYESMLLCSSSF